MSITASVAGDESSNRMALKPNDAVLKTPRRAFGDLPKNVDTPIAKAFIHPAKTSLKMPVIKSATEFLEKLDHNEDECFKAEPCSVVNISTSFDKLCAEKVDEPIEEEITEVVYSDEEMEYGPPPEYYMKNFGNIGIFDLPEREDNDVLLVNESDEDDVQIDDEDCSNSMLDNSDDDGFVMPKYPSFSMESLAADDSPNSESVENVPPPRNVEKVVKGLFMGGFNEYIDRFERNDVILVNAPCVDEPDHPDIDDFKDEVETRKRYNDHSFDAAVQTLRDAARQKTVENAELEMKRCQEAIEALNDAKSFLEGQVKHLETMAAREIMAILDGNRGDDGDVDEVD